MERNMRAPRITLSLLLLLTIILSSCKDDNGSGVPPIDPDIEIPEGSEIPFFVINSNGNTIPDEPKVSGSLQVFVNQQLVFSNPIGIELRGSTSRRLFPKVSYGIEFWDQNGEDVSLEILDFGKEEDWVLHGPYSDKTLLRNVLLYDLSNDIGRWASKTQLIELNINGEYAGVYVFMEKVKRDGDRLDIEPMDQTVTSGVELTGGYLLKIDKTSGDTNNSDWPGDAIYTEELGFRSDYSPNENVHAFDAYGNKRGTETYFLYEYPRVDAINAAQKDYIQQYIRDFEDALVAEDFSGATRDYENYIDVNSFVDFFILNELSANPDAYRLSTYLHKYQNNKLAMGPAWDFNIAFGNDGRSATNEWIYEFNDRNPNDLWLVHFWWEKLLADPRFRATVKTRWTALRSTQLSQTTIDSKIDNWITYLDANGAIDRNFTQWPVIGFALPFNSFVGNSFEEEVDYVKNWIQQRATWMDSEIQAW